MARGVRTPAKKPAAKPAAAKPTPVATQEQPAAKPAEVIQDNVQQATEVATQAQTAPVQSPTIIVKEATKVNTDVQEHVQHDVGSAQVSHDGSNPVKTLDEIGFQTGVDMVGFKDKAAKLAFLEEKLTINIMETTDKNAEKFVYVAVNGEGAGFKGEPFLPRGVDVVVKRKHVEKLLRSRPSRYESQEYMAENGERKIKYPETAALLYPFQIISDPSPEKGRAWMKQIISERA